MSVIANVPEEEEEIMDTKFRYAIVGCRAAGKTAFSFSLLSKFKEKFGNYTSQILKSSNVSFETYHGIDENLLRHIYCEANEQYWVKKIHEQINPLCDLIVIDDVRYKCEVQYLKSLGFKIIFLDTDWMIRLERIVNQHDKNPDLKNQIRWFYTDSEIEMETLPDTFYDYRISLKAADSTEKRLEKFETALEELLATGV